MLVELDVLGRETPPGQSEPVGCTRHDLPVTWIGDDEDKHMLGAEVALRAFDER